jgi:hypothetical protein
MAQTKKGHRSKKRRANNNISWIWAAIAGGVVLVIAAIALFARGNDSGGEKTFDPNFEPTVTGAPAVAVLPQDVIDYGDVKLGSTINTVFKVRNVGDQPLMVLGEPQVELAQGC